MGRRKKFHLEFTFAGEPLTKSNEEKIGRRRRGRGGKPIFFIPARIKNYEAALAEAAKVAMQEAGLKPTSKLVKVELWYYLGTKRRKDLQNLPKTTLDALNNIVYDDDSQVLDAEMHKRLDRKNPRVVIVVKETSDVSWERP